MPDPPLKDGVDRRPASLSAEEAGCPAPGPVTVGPGGQYRPAAGAPAAPAWRPSWTRAATPLASRRDEPVLQRFDDPETERAFLRAERAERGQAIRALIVIAIATLISYIVINPMHFPPAGVIAYTQAAAR